MKKHVLLCLLATITFASSLLGQIPNKQTKIIGSYDTLGVKIVEIETNNGIDFYLLFNNSKDSILFRNESKKIIKQYNDENSCIIYSRQLNNSRYKEIILQFEGDLTCHIYIFNLDTKEVIFQGLNKVFERVDFATHYENLMISQYEINFDQMGNLFITYFEHTDKLLYKDKKEGLYTLVNGKYEWKSDCIHSHICCEVDCYCCSASKFDLIQNDLTANPNKLSGEYYAYNSGDKIHFFSVNDNQYMYPFNCKHRIVDSVQINGTGSLEAIFLRTCSNSMSENNGSTYISLETQLEKYEIWDLDSKTLLFEVISSYWSKTHANYFGAKNGTSSFAHNFSIDSLGIITISRNLKVKNGDSREEPNYWPARYKSIGTYKFVDSKYVKID